MKDSSLKIALGTVQFGLKYGIGNIQGRTNSVEASKILDTAFSYGIRVIDTAQAYGDSEKVLGKLHDNRFQIITKINPSPKDSRSTELIVQESLENLNLKYLHGVLFHSASSAINNPRIVEELKNIKRVGIIQKLGFSVYTPKELQELIAKYGMPDIIQIPYNHLDRRFEQIATDLHQKGVEIHTRSAFLQGLFFLNNEDLPEFFKPIAQYLFELKNKFSNSDKLAQALLNYCLCKEFIDFVVIGVNNEAQLNENISGSKILWEDLPEAPKNIEERILMPNLWPKN